MFFRRKAKTENKPIFSMISGASGLPRNIGISGDSYMCRRLPDNHYVIAIADGMGTGSAAAECSRFVLDSLYQMLRMGLDCHTALYSVNSAIPLHSEPEYFSTLDMALFDLNSGICHMYKSGAAPTLIQRNSDVGIIRLPSMPMGILERLDYREFSFEIHRGDHLFFMSDGVSEAAPPDNQLDWARQIILTNPEDRPRAMSERLIWGATLRYGQSERDDMTVISAEIV